jgi:hypothetical protein
MAKTMPYYEVRERQASYMGRKGYFEIKKYSLTGR